MPKNVWGTKVPTQIFWEEAGKYLRNVSGIAKKKDLKFEEIAKRVNPRVSKLKQQSLDAIAAARKRRDMREVKQLQQDHDSEYRHWPADGVTGEQCENKFDNDMKKVSFSLHCTS